MIRAIRGMSRAAAAGSARQSKGQRHKSVRPRQRPPELTRFKFVIRLLARVSRAAWRLEQAERERTWALPVSARADGISIRTLAAAAGLSPCRVHQLVAGADLDALDAAPGELRAAGWPAPGDPDPGRTPNSAAGTPSLTGYLMPGPAGPGPGHRRGQVGAGELNRIDAYCK
jgi:hypothetical protein